MECSCGRQLSLCHWVHVSSLAVQHLTPLPVEGNHSLYIESLRGSAPSLWTFKWRSLPCVSGAPPF